MTFKQDLPNQWIKARFLIMLMLPFWIGSFMLLAYFGYVNSFLFLNHHHMDSLDNIMLQITQFGDGALLIPILVFIFVWKKPELIITIIIASIFCGIITFLCKTYLFAHWDRPLAVIGNQELVHTVNHYLLFKHSFPSGHTICITTILTTVALSNYRSRITVFFLTLIILLVSYSRIYLGVHFLGDVFVGSLIGTVISLSTMAYFLEPVSYGLKNITPLRLKFLKGLILILAVITLAYKICYWI